MGICFFIAIFANDMKYVDVILPLPLPGLFTYSVPEEMEGKVVFGKRLLVPLGKSKKYIAMAVKTHDVKPAFGVKPIEQVLDEEPTLLPQQYRLWSWIGEYYMSPLGDVYNAAFPAGLKSTEKFKPKMELYVELASAYRNPQALRVAISMMARAVKQSKTFMTFLQLSHWDRLLEDELDENKKNKVTKEELMNESHSTSAIVKTLIDKGFLFTYELEVGRLNTSGEAHFDQIKPLSMSQQDAYNQILMQMMKKNVVLLHGVTSSGKTEVYIHLIKQALDEHKQVLYLLPEIALTVQIMERLHRVFGDRLGIYHSKYSDAERVEIWQKQMSGHPYDVILGARSAVFLPFQNLGLVIIDEEHETSFKQQDPCASLSCPQCRHHVGKHVWSQNAARYCHAFDGELLQCPARQVWSCRDENSLPRHPTARNPGGGCQGLEASQDDEGCLFSSTLGCREGSLGEWRASHPLPKPPWLCADDRVQGVRLGAEMQELRCIFDAP